MLESSITINITTGSHEDKWTIGTYIHEKLRGCEDYINSKIGIDMRDERIFIWVEKDSIDVFMKRLGFKQIA